MDLRRKMVLGAATLGALLLLGLAGATVVGAQRQWAPVANPSSAPGQSSMPLGAGMGGHMLALDRIGALLGMTPDQIIAERKTGKSMVDIAREKGVSEQQLTEVAVQGMRDLHNRYVGNGSLTQGQADSMNGYMEEIIKAELNRQDPAGVDSYGICGGNSSGGMMNGATGNMMNGNGGGMMGGNGAGMMGGTL